MPNYTAVTVGGVNLFIDPDTASPTIRPYVKVVPACSGTTFVHRIQTNPSNTGFAEDLNIGGAYLDEAAVRALNEKARGKVIVSVVGVPVVDSYQKYIILSVTSNPTKPGIEIDGEVVERHTYSISMQRVDIE